MDFCIFYLHFVILPRTFNAFNMKKVALLCLFALSVFAVGAADFNDVFCDSTLRLDYIFGADSKGTHVLLTQQNRIKGWHGRRHGLKRLPLLGNGVITVTDFVSGDTIYRTSFSSLFSEWLSTPEAETTPSGFENSFMVPLPRNKANIDIQILDNRHESIGGMCHTFNPDDVLIVDKTAVTPLPTDIYILRLIRIILLMWLYLPKDILLLKWIVSIIMLRWRWSRF